jgi:hypothetical protein
MSNHCEPESEDEWCARFRGSHVVEAKGFLFPLGRRARLVQLNERSFLEFPPQHVGEAAAPEESSFFELSAHFHSAHGPVRCWRVGLRQSHA